MKFLLSFAFVLVQLFTAFSAPVDISSAKRINSKRSYVPAELVNYNVYFVKPENWGDHIYAYVYTEEEELKEYVSANWPGSEISRLGETDNYYVSYPQKLFGHSSIIFSDGINQVPKINEEGFDLVKSAAYTIDGIVGIVDQANNTKIVYGNYALIYYHPSVANLATSYNALKLYIHYKIADGEWIDAEITRNPYTNYFIKEIDLEDAENITFSITNGNDICDDNNGEYYKFGKFENIYINSNVKF